MLNYIFNEGTKPTIICTKENEKELGENETLYRYKVTKKIKILITVLFIFQF